MQPADYKIIVNQFINETRRKHLFKGTKNNRSPKPFILATENQHLIKYSNFCRSLDSKLGIFIEKLAKEIIGKRFTCLTDLDVKHVKDKTKVTVDLCFFKEDIWNIIELKAGGNIDSKKTKSERESLDKLKVVVSKLKKEKARFFYAAGYDASTNNKSAYSKLNFTKEELLIGKKFWECICDDSMNYNYILDIFKCKFKQTIKEL